MNAQGRVQMMVILGSGGHTAEMLRIVKELKPEKLSSTLYVAAETDSLSLQKADAYHKQVEKQSQGTSSTSSKGSAYYEKIPRSRHVGQSYITSIWTTLIALLVSMSLVVKWKPKLVIANGPGTCLPIVICAAVLRFVGFMRCEIVFVESIARVQDLSLTGKILYHTRATSSFLVQWPELQAKYQRSVYLGRVY